ncbi:MAG: serine/threonine-protein phosphatase, partial [Synergistaceae bacterium]|nr:serine/threonine-protein phosphatase [Synergistaceae bacterium]
IIAANAGHEYPAVYRKETGHYELLKAKNSPAVATMEGMKFKQYEFKPNKGDELYLYTDGVAEATNSNGELYGTDRMIEALDGTVGMSVKDILITMKKSVDDFTGDAPQFDDITMMSLKFYGKEV